MSVKVNKALDYNKLLDAQRMGKQLGKSLPKNIIASIKYDGNYTVTSVLDGVITHYTSGGLTYKHTDTNGDFFKGVQDGYYLAERIEGKGKLGDRVRCNLRGPKSAQTSTGHTYKVFNYLTEQEYIKGKSDTTYYGIKNRLKSLGVPDENIAEFYYVTTKEELFNLLGTVVSDGYEGLIGASSLYKWEHHKTRRTTDLFKLKNRPTVDLWCIGVKGGEGKYEGMVGSLHLKDSENRVVSVGSGLSDADRLKPVSYFLGKVWEVEYEQILDTYIQPTIIGLREDKDEKGID